MVNWQSMISSGTTTGLYTTTSAMSMIGNSGTPSATNSSICNSIYVTNGQTTPLVGTNPLVSNPYTSVENYYDRANIHIRLGDVGIVHFPDGTKINYTANGSFTIIDKDAKIVYAANRVRPFNRYVNTSDLLEEFIKFCGIEAHVRKPEMLDLPLKLFIGWLVLEAAKADEEPAPDIKVIPDLRKVASPKCRSCGRFIPLHNRRQGIEVCNTTCFERQMEKTKCLTAP